VVQFEHGTLAFPSTPFSRGHVQVAGDGFSAAPSGLAWRPAPAGFRAEASGLEIRVRLRPAGFSISVRNRRSAPLTLREIRIRFEAAEQREPLQADDWLEFIHGFNFAAPSGVKRVGLANTWLPHNPESSLVYALRRRTTGDVLLFSSLPPHRGDFVRFQALHEAPHLEGRFGLLIVSRQDRLLKPGAVAESTTIQAVTGADPLRLLESVGARWARARRRPLKPVETGWNSWDYYSGAVSARVMRDNQRAAGAALGTRLRTWVIDEGWEPRWGAWVPNWKFPDGLRTFCRETRARGGRPGIWTAPLLVNTYLDLFADRPDWFLRDAQGQIVQRRYTYGPMAFLDVTHPEAAAWLTAVFTRLRKAGFSYFKVDFTQEILAAAAWHDPTVPRGALLNRAFRLIRRAIGPDAYLLACGAPYESVTGLVDAVRVTGDIHHFWSHIRFNAGSLAARWWMHRRLWNVDPDFLIVRTAETCTLKRRYRPFTERPVHYDVAQYWTSGREMTLREARTLALLVYVSGGDLFLSDPIPSLNAEGRKLLRTVLKQPLPEAATPIDLFDRHDGLPRLWLTREPGSAFLGVFNWEEDPADLRIDLSSLGLASARAVRSFWSNEAVPLQDRAFTVRLNARESQGFRIRTG